MNFGNPVLILSALSWVLAQLIKGTVQRIVEGTFSIEQFLASGGMPSSHSALVTCCAVTMGMLYGFDSGLFAIAALFAIVVMYDAANIRWQAGKHAKVLNALLARCEEEDGVPSEGRLKELLGHTPIQVLAGAVLGVAIGLLGAYFVT